MRYTLSILEEDHSRLTNHLFDGSGEERGAYLLCGVGVAEDETRLLVRSVLPVLDEDVVEASPVHMRIRSVSYVRAMKQADLDRSAFVFVHSHPTGLRRHSEKDDAEEETLFPSVYNRVTGSGPHASLIFTAPDFSIGRVWFSDGSTAPIERMRIIGRRFRFQFHEELPNSVPALYDRQVRAFGSGIQALLQRLRIGVVGAGGTGSAVAEQLVRLGVGGIVVADGDVLDATNVNRVYGSAVADEGRPKPDLVVDSARRIGLGTIVTPIYLPITYRSAMRQLLGCDLIFCCTDDEWGRSLLNRLALYQYIPVIDMGVRIDSEEGIIRSIQGRVTVLMPGIGCLLCSRRITPHGVRAQMLQAVAPHEAEGLRREGYAPELADPDPAVIAFTTTIASTAVAELLQRLTGFMGDDRDTTEVLHLFDEGRMLRTRRTPAADCLCSQRQHWGRGDTKLFLGVRWRPE